ncbi:MAG: M91 family zinc metallopeptidase [Gammaproteobacteria bacterium]
MLINYRSYNYIKIDADPLPSSDEKKAAKNEGVIPKKGFEKAFPKVIKESLDIVTATQVGKRMLASLERAGKEVVIKFPRLWVATGMKKCGGSPNTNKALGQPFREPITASNPRATFAAAFRLSGTNHAAVARFIMDSSQETGDQIRVDARTVRSWLEEKDALPDSSRREFRYLALALEPWLAHGVGAKCTIEFDPWNELTGTSKRPTHVGLFHELVHAWYYVSGRQIFTDDHPENEYMVIGLPGFTRRANGHRRLYSENVYRTELGMTLRPGL